ncbi:TetR/AcrR family transcriptional regulator [Amycolatopsis sp. CA-230715]|uniref:TetR/AcrR family transcriptional regulator n=1 Tax=Amycolatopsis sp. CA-230715 TaxID=2745196 RepID=UPI001C01402E|nr:TetR/AcrR family transcriptional regulator [Amycolatopsis sp. CA-230715]QWF81775.1 putative HTH-type transcriptional regulator [Amycolatopsis sp. CA-230715]
MDDKRHSESRAPSGLADTRSRPASTRVSDDVLLDAARSCVLDRGVRRTTLAEIARTAKVSRMTLYRRFPDVRSVLAALMTREFGTLLWQASEEGASAPTARERLVLSSVAAVRGLSSNALMRTVLDKDAELVLPYIVERLGTTQRFAEGVISSLLKEGLDDGSIRITDEAAQSRTLLLVIQSFAFSLRPAAAGVAEEKLLDELAHLLGAALRP